MAGFVFRRQICENWKFSFPFEFYFKKIPFFGYPQKGDAQLPVALAKLIQWKGLDCLHTDELPNKERTGDDELRKISLDQNRIVNSKDTDFLETHLLNGIPPKLLMVTTGNIGNKQLLNIFDKNWTEIVKQFQNHNLIEIDNFDIIVFG